MRDAALRRGGARRNDVWAPRMPYLMHIAFDNPFRLLRNVYYFEYKGVRFKLVQNNPRKWADVVLTIVNSYDSPAAQHAFSTAGEFASALGWVNKVGIPVRHIGGPGVRAIFRLRQARCNTFVFPEIAFRGMHVGYSMSRIAKITDDHQRIGLTLFREAHSANKVLLSLLLYWQILEIRDDAVGWTNKVMRTQPRALHRVREYLQQLPLKGRRLGEYLQEDCRHAIAHIRRKPGRTPQVRRRGYDQTGLVYGRT